MHKRWIACCLRQKVNFIGKTFSKSGFSGGNWTYNLMTTLPLSWLQLKRLEKNHRGTGTRSRCGKPRRMDGIFEHWYNFRGGYLCNLTIDNIRDGLHNLSKFVKEEYSRLTTEEFMKLPFHIKCCILEPDVLVRELEIHMKL